MEQSFEKLQISGDKDELEINIETVLRQFQQLSATTPDVQSFKDHIIDYYTHYLQKLREGKKNIY